MVKKDNSSLRVKVALRRAFLPKDARVLDLFCGDGCMYRAVYRGHCAKYLGLDKVKTHDCRICMIVDNQKWLSEQALAGFNVFDLDAYGSPLRMLQTIIAKMTEEEIVIFVTDGLPQTLMHCCNTAPPRIVRQVENLSDDWALAGGISMYQFYPQFFATLLKKCERAYRVRVSRWIFSWNPRHTCAYHALLIKACEVPRIAV